MNIGQVNVASVLTKSNLPIAGYSVNPYVGCTHACKYCYACFMRRLRAGRAVGRISGREDMAARKKSEQIRRANDDRGLGYGRVQSAGGDFWPYPAHFLNRCGGVRFI